MLSVSKSWQQNILGLSEFQRTLFLAPQWMAKDYLEWERDKDHAFWLGGQQSIVHEPSESTTIVSRVAA